MSSPLAERYVRLGLALGRHVEEAVDAYFGPSELAAEVDARPADPCELVAEADELLAELEDGWLRDQVRGLRTSAGVLAGEATSWADEVDGCYGVRPTRTDKAVFAEGHAHLDHLLPGRRGDSGAVSPLAALDPRAPGAHRRAARAGDSRGTRVDRRAGRPPCR